MLEIFCIDKIRKMATIVKHVKSVELVEPKLDMKYPFDNSVKSYSFSGRSGQAWIGFGLYIMDKVKFVVKEMI